MRIVVCVCALVVLLGCTGCGTRPQYVVPDIGEVINQATMQLTGQENTPARKVRHFAVYKNSRLVLKAEDKPGILLSTAAPGPEGPAKHAWINAQAYRSTVENELGALLRGSKNFDGFMGALLSNGYDLFSVDAGPLPPSIREGHRIADGNTLIAVVWDHPGQFSTLQQQPEVGSLNSGVASMVVYAAGKGSNFVQLFLRARSYEDLLEGVKSLRLKASSL
jgi:hypothetical protein